MQPADLMCPEHNIELRDYGKGVAVYQCPKCAYFVLKRVYVSA